MEKKEADQSEGQAQTKLVPTVEKKEETRWITFELNDKQVLEKANKASALNTKIEDLNTQKKKSAESFKGKIQVATTELNDIFAIISSRTERKELECVVIYDYEKRKIFVTVDDETKEEVEMSDYDFENRPAHIMPKEVETTEETDEAGSLAETENHSTEQEAFFDESEDSEKATSQQAAVMQNEVNTAMVVS